MSHIFIAGSYFATKKEFINNYTFISNIIKKQLNNIGVIMPVDIENYRNNLLKNNPKLSEEELNNEMVKYDLNMVVNCKYMIADVTNKSTGLGIELGIIKQNNIPLELIAKKGTAISNMVFGAFPKSKINYYNNLQELEEIIIKIINKHKV